MLKKCEFCDREFETEEALNHHTTAKHQTAEKKEKRGSGKKIRNWSIFLVVIALVIGSLYWAFSAAAENADECKTAPAVETNIGGHTNLALHIHQNLQIIIDGKPELIPANIGISQGIMRPLHTHDTSGELHVEGLCERDFVLGDIFTIWDKTFNSECIFDKCTDQGTLTMKVNGAPNTDFENLILKDKDNIVIEFKTN